MQLSDAARDNQVYKIVQMKDYGLIATSSAGGEVDFAKSFKFADLNQAASFVAIFDQYRIDELEVWIDPNSSGVIADSRKVDVIDYDDDNTATYASLSQYSNAAMTNRNEGVYRRFRPHIAVATYSGAFTSFKNEVSDWIDSGSTNVAHYGIKLAMLSTATTYTIELRVRFHLSFRNVF